MADQDDGTKLGVVTHAPSFRGGATTETTRQPDGVLTVPDVHPLDKVLTRRDLLYAIEAIAVSISRGDPSAVLAGLSLPDRLIAAVDKIAEHWTPQ